MERKQCIYAADAMLELTFYFTIFMQDLSIFRVLFLREGIIKKKKNFTNRIENEILFAIL